MLVCVCLVVCIECMVCVRCLLVTVWLFDVCWYGLVVVLFVSYRLMCLIVVRLCVLVS